MKWKLYLFLFAALWSASALAQGSGCNNLQFSYSTSESRCMATGSINVQASGGSGHYNYKAEGPVSTPFTSSPLITGLPPGTYRVTVKDVTTGCVLSQENAVVPGTYSDPRFVLSKTDASCAGNDGTITAGGLQYGRSPFTYTIIAPSPAQVGASNTTGTFTGLTAGEYAVRLEDSCGGIQVRRITIETYNWFVDNYSINRVGCDSADAVVNLRDNKGTPVGAIPGFSYAVVRSPGDTLWFSSHTFRFYIGKLRSATIVVRDLCGGLKTASWSLAPNRKPSIGSVTTSAFACATFSATVTAPQNLTNPQYCVYRDGDPVPVACNTTGAFTGLYYGSYCIRMTDACYDTVITRCFSAVQPKPSVASSLTISNRTCATFTARVTGQTNLYNPLYCLYDAANTVIGCNATGEFNNLAYGSYCVRITDDCTDSLITRCITVARPAPTITGVTVSGSTCTGFNVSTGGSNLINPQYCLYDNNGNVIACNSTGVFPNLPHGSYCIRAISCGDTTAPSCFSNVPPRPAAAATVQISNRTCSGFTAAVTGQANWTNPQFCLYDSTNALVSCNSTGVFAGIPYGAYCIRATDGCVDTTISRCFSQARAVPSVNTTMQQTAAGCSTFSARVTGTNLTSPQYCLYDTLNNLIACNATGEFTNIPYGRYCVTVEDGCVDTTFRICQTFATSNSITVTSTRACTVGSSNLAVQFSGGNAPYTVTVYGPSGAVVYSGSGSTLPLNALVPALPAGQQYKVVGRDNCGTADSTLVSPNASVVSRTITAASRCPSSVWLNGSGDLQVTCTSNLGAITPSIIRKNNASFSRSFSSVSGNQYRFADLEPATYVLEYALQNCSNRLYDTFTVHPYAYPTQGQSAIYQCDNNSFSLGADVSGGIGPYNYQIIGSMPEAPSIATGVQSSPLFTINNGTTYSLVRLRTIDACGNATLNDVSVLPLQNIAITVTNECFYTDVTLAVDTIPNAEYAWYRKRTLDDSVYVGDGPVLELPFVLPEQIGTYVCKVSVNDECLVRLAQYELTGDCHEVLPTAVRLQGRAEAEGNVLSWTPADSDVRDYVVERKGPGQSGFTAIGTLGAGRGDYSFTDKAPGTAQYRLKVRFADGSTAYTNVVVLKGTGYQMTVYPNPVKDGLTVLLNGAAADYRIELLNLKGQVVYRQELKGAGRISYRIARHPAWTPGAYLLKATPLKGGAAQTFKLLFE